MLSRWVIDVDKDASFAVTLLRYSLGSGRFRRFLQTWRNADGIHHRSTTSVSARLSLGTRTRARRRCESSFIISLPLDGK